MIHRGRPSFVIGTFERVKTLEWLYPVAAFIIANNGSELLGILREHGLTRAGLSAAAVLILRGVYLWWRDNQREVVT